MRGMVQNNFGDEHPFFIKWMVIRCYSRNEKGLIYPYKNGEYHDP
jgi:hypothetical protein